VSSLRGNPALKSGEDVIRNMKIPLTVWKKNHVFQEKPGWCGPAICQMIFKVAHMRKTQAEIAKDIYKPWWGTGQSLLFAYLSRYFALVNFKNNGKITDISRHLNKGHIVIVNWWDNLEESEEADGHYSLAIAYNPITKKLILADPSNTRKGIWTIGMKEFDKRWYDYLDVHTKTWTEGWMVWLDPKSKKDDII
jgi:hypothetical protein